MKIIISNRLKNRIIERVLKYKTLLFKILILKTDYPHI